METGLLKLLTPRKKTYIQCPSVQDWSDASVSRILDHVESQQKGKLEMADILKGGEPPKKKKGKKKAAPKKAAKKKAAKKK
jgi:hypothetical protein